MATGYQFQAFPPGTSAATVTGAGNALGGDATTVCTIVYGVEMVSTGTVNFEHTVDGMNWHALAVKDTSSTAGTLVTSTTVSGIFQADATGSQAVRPNVSANGSGITITANKVLG